MLAKNKKERKRKLVAELKNDKKTAGITVFLFNLSLVSSIQENQSLSKMFTYMGMVACSYKVKAISFEHMLKLLL